MSLLDSTQGLKRVNSRQNNTELIALTLRRSRSLLKYSHLCSCSTDRNDQKGLHFALWTLREYKISFDSFMTRFVHAYYSSRMIDRFLNWYDHGKPKSAKVKGRGHPASPTLVVRIYTTLCLFGWILTHCNFLFRKYKTVNIKGLFAGYF